MSKKYTGTALFIYDDVLYAYHYHKAINKPTKKEKKKRGKKNSFCDVCARVCVCV